MGSCGCGDWTAHHRLQVDPCDGAVWALQIYDGCEYCDSGPRLIVQRHQARSAFYDFVKDTRILEWTWDDGESYQEAQFPLIRSDSLVRAIVKTLFGSHKDGLDDLAAADLQGLSAIELLDEINDQAIAILRTMVCDTMRRGDKGRLR